MVFSKVLVYGKIGQPHLQQLKSLILGTIEHEVEKDVKIALKLMMDIDLAILGADTIRFTEFEKQIREEYIFVPLAQYFHKRGDIM